MMPVERKVCERGRQTELASLGCFCRSRASRVCRVCEAVRGGSRWEEADKLLLSMPVEKLIVKINAVAPTDRPFSISMQTLVFFFYSHAIMMEVKPRKYQYRE